MAWLLYSEVCAKWLRTRYLYGLVSLTYNNQLYWAWFCWKHVKMPWWMLQVVPTKCIAGMCWARFFFGLVHINPLGSKKKEKGKKNQLVVLFSVGLCQQGCMVVYNKCILVTCMVDNILILQGEIRWWSWCKFIFLQWYMVTVVHVYNRFHSSEIRCFVNGKVVSTGETTLVHANEVKNMFKNCFLVKAQRFFRLLCGYAIYNRGNSSCFWRLVVFLVIWSSRE